MDKKEWIPVDDLKEGYLYEIRARNSRLGIWRKERDGFEISRFKFGANFVFVEIHWDLSRNFGTVKPYKKIEKVPKFENEQEVLDYLNTKAKKLGLLSSYAEKVLNGEKVRWDMRKEYQKAQEL